MNATLKDYTRQVIYNIKIVQNQSIKFSKSYEKFKKLNYS